MSPEEAVTTLYRGLIDGWNAGDAEAMAAPVAPEGLFVLLHAVAAWSRPAAAG